MVPAGATAHKQTSSEVRVPFPVEAGGSTRLPGEFASGRGVSLWRGDRPTFGGVLEVRRIVRDCAYWTDNLLRLGPSERERERKRDTEILTNPILGKESISPGSDPPGATRVRRGTLLRFGKSLDGVFKPHPSNHSPMGIFSRIRRREKRKNTCAHKFLFETTKTTSGSSIS